MTATRLIISYMATALLCVAATPETASADAALGGGASFDPGSVFPFVAGAEARIETSFFVQNLGDQPAEVEINAGLPTGLSIETLVDSPIVLDPGAGMNVPFAIVSDPLLAVGRNEVIVTLGQVNMTAPEGGGSVYAPAIGGRLVIDSRGESATINISAVSDVTGTPARGLFGLYSIGEGAPVRMEEAEGTGFTRVVPPGDYRVTFEVPGLDRQSRDVSVADGDDLDVVLEISTLSFDRIAATPTFEGSSNNVVTAELSASVTNNLRRIPGPVRLEVTVGRDGEVVDTIDLATFPELPPGQTTRRSSYRPEQGFDTGVWTFRFALIGPNFVVSAPGTDGFEVISSGFLSLSWWTWIVVILLALFILWWLVGRRRQRDEVDEAEYA